jgi:hypothetical protein
VFFQRHLPRKLILRERALRQKDRIQIDGSAAAEAQQSYIALLRLDPIRRDIRPENWPAQRGLVLSVVQHVARGMIAATDALAIHGDEACVITFGETTYENAALGAAAIGRKIVQSLFGESGLRRVRLEPRVLPLKDLALHGDFSAAAGAAHVVMPGDGPTAMPAGARQQAPAAVLTRDEKRTRRQQIIGLFNRDQSASLFNTYLPIWNADRKKADRFLLVPCRDDGPPAAACGYSILGHAPSDKCLLAFDMAAIEGGLLALKRAIDADVHGELMLPLHFDTAGGNQGRAELLEIFPNLPSFVRGRLSLALFGVPSGIPQSRLHEVAGALRRLVKDVLIVLEPRAGNGPALRNMAALVRSVGMPGVALSLPSGRSDDDLDAACAIGSRAASLGLAVCALGVVSGRQAHRLSVAGCTSFGGTLFGGPFRDLPPPYAVHAKIFERND